MCTQVIQRGDPLAKTLWGPSEMRQYVKFQLAMLKENRIKRHQLGGYGFKVPQAPNENKRADLPKDVLDFLRKSKSSSRNSSFRDREYSDWTSLPFLYFWSCFQFYQQICEKFMIAAERFNWHLFRHCLGQFVFAEGFEEVVQQYASQA